jgi:FMN phosphatase YigB (HAD superfamily)
VKKYNVISVDMFGTLADLSSINQPVWKEILGNEYTPQLAEKYWNAGSEKVLKFFESEILGKGRYVPPRSMFEQCYSHLFPEKGINSDPRDAAEILASHHSQSRLFTDVAPFLDSVGNEYPICLSSDTDEDMLGPLREIHYFDKVFTSEELGAYKTGSEGRFFKAVVDHYGIEPESILHIGDSIADIAGASQAGVATCWLNRTSATWEYEIVPDIEVSSLFECAELLNIEINPSITTEGLDS